MFKDMTIVALKEAYKKVKEYENND